MGTFDFRASQVRTNKIIASGSTGTNAQLLVYPYGVASNTSGTINTSLFNTSSIGSDVFIFFSGSVGSLGGSSHGAAVFGGDLYVSGNIKVAGTLTTSSVVTASYPPRRLYVGRYTTTVNTSSNAQSCGFNEWNPTDAYFTANSSSIFFQAVMYAQTGSQTTFVQLYNATSGAFVEIGGPGVSYLSTTSSFAVKVLSVNLTGAINFVTGSSQVYEVFLYTSAATSTAFLGAGEILTR